MSCGDCTSNSFAIANLLIAVSDHDGGQRQLSVTVTIVTQETGHNDGFGDQGTPGYSENPGCQQAQTVSIERAVTAIAMVANDYDVASFFISIAPIVSIPTVIGTYPIVGSIPSSSVSST
jgi:hypothetical protein